MKLDWMRLTNFRQFYGEQVIRFSRDNKQNVTVVHGVNGAGKTSMFIALNWVLYGLGAENIGELVSKQAIAEATVGEDIETKIQLAFSHAGQRFIATRALTVTKISEKDWQTKPQVEFSLDVIRADGQTRNIPNPTGYIESILPSNVRTYFFFDGEKIDQFARPSHEAEVREAVRNVLKIEILERAKTHLDAVAREYQRELKKHASGGLEELLDREARLRNEIEKARKRLSELREERAAAQRQIQEIDMRLGEIQEIRGWDEQRKVTHKEMAILEREKDRLWQEIKEAANRGFFRFAAGATSKALTVLDEKRERGEIPPGIREQFVQDLLARRVCICGRPIEENSEEQRRLVEILDQSVPSELETVVIQAAGDLRAIQRRIEAVPDQLRELMRRKAAIDDQMEELHAKLDEISRHLQGFDHEEVAALEKKRVEYGEKVQGLASDIGRYEERIENLRKRLDELKTSIEKMRVSVKRAQGIQKRFSLARKAADAIEAMFDVFAHDMRESIQIEAKKIFQRLVWKESQFQDIRLSEDYHLEVIDRWGLPARPELSAGERQVLSLAFITGMAKVTGEEAPLVMDTPFGRLSSAHRESITQHIPEIADQLILFVTDEELHSQARANLGPRIGAEYELVFDQATGCTSIREIMPAATH
jgi:DNA sulfur modification protein DndD